MMKNKSEDDQKRKALLDGISQNISIVDISHQTGITHRELVRDIRNMRRKNDPDLLEAQNIAEAENDEKKKVASQRHDKAFFEMAGLTLQEKTFQNMIFFYKPELNQILSSRDQDAAIRKLPTSVRKTLVKNNILTRRGKLQVSQIAIKYL
jgi:hypothetical protein